LYERPDPVDQVLKTEAFLPFSPKVRSNLVWLREQRIGWRLLTQSVCGVYLQEIFDVIWNPDLTEHQKWEKETAEMETLQSI
jgi:hypothetical protein